MANSTSIILSSLLLFFFLVPSVISQATAPAPAPAGPVNLTAILEKDSQFKTFIHLLNTTQASFQVSIQLNSSAQGITVFAPTDNAFNNLKPGTLNGLTSQQQVQLVLYHVTPKYYALSDLLSVSNPVRTLATGQDGGVFGLNFTGQGNQVNVSTGVVETQINNPLRQQFPLAVYVVDKVLLPEQLFGTKAPSGAPAPETKVPSGYPAPETSPSDVESPAAEKHKSGSGRIGTGFGLVLGLAWLCFGLLSWTSN